MVRTSGRKFAIIKLKIKKEVKNEKRKRFHTD